MTIELTRFDKKDIQEWDENERRNLCTGRPKKKTGISGFEYKGLNLKQEKQKTVLTYHLMAIVDEIIEKDKYIGLYIGESG